MSPVTLIGRTGLKCLCDDPPVRPAACYGIAGELNEAYWETLTGVTELFKKYGNSPDLYVSFSDVPKVGIHPGVEARGGDSAYRHHDPYGVYLYPIKWLRTNIDFFTTFTSRPYIIVAKVPRDDGFLDLAQVTKEEARALLSKIGLGDTFMKFASMGRSEIIAYRKNKYRGAREDASGWSKPGALLWETLEQELARRDYKPLSLWNTLFARMGVWAVRDSHGIVAKMETSQLIVMDVRKIKVVEIIDNEQNDASIPNTYFRAVVDKVLDAGWKMRVHSDDHGQWHMVASGTHAGAKAELSLYLHSERYDRAAWEATLGQPDGSQKRYRYESAHDSLLHSQMKVADMAAVTAKSIVSQIDTGSGEKNLISSKPDTLAQFDALRIFFHAMCGRSMKFADAVAIPGGLQIKHWDPSGHGLLSEELEARITGWPSGRLGTRVTVHWPQDEETQQSDGPWVGEPFTGGVDGVRKMVPGFKGLLERAIDAMEFPAHFNPAAARKCIRQRMGFKDIVTSVDLKEPEEAQ